MSQAHIPQPDSATAAPSEQYGSTEAAPTGLTVSGIGVPGPAPDEVPSHTLAFNSVDPVLYKQFIYNSSFIWSVNDTRGKLLWTMPIHPKAYNKITARLSTIYNTWGGGVDVNIKIAGTGFHAGALVFVRIPPNVDPKKLAGSYDFTAFEYVVIDPKQLEVATIHIGDQRQINYHYQLDESNTPKSFSIGGTLAAYVYMGLNTASTGTQQIEVLMATRLAPDFGFSQLIMPSPEQDADADFIPDGLATVLQFSKQKNNTNNLFDARINVLTVVPKATPSADKNVYNVIQLDGTPYADSDFDKYMTLTANVVGDRLEAKYKRFNKGLTCNDTVLVMNTIKNDNKFFKITDHVFEDTNNTFKSATKPPDGWAVGDELEIFTFGYAVKEQSFKKVFTPPLPESLVGFQGFSADLGYAWQTQQLAKYLSTGTAKNFLVGQCALFSVYDVVEDLPLFFVKLYPEGFLTALPSEKKVNWLLSRIELRYLSMIGRTTTIPLNSDFSRNKLLLASVHKKILRNEQREIIQRPWNFSAPLAQYQEQELIPEQ